MQVDAVLDDMAECAAHSLRQEEGSEVEVEQDLLKQLQGVDDGRYGGIAVGHIGGQSCSGTVYVRLEYNVSELGRTRYSLSTKTYVHDM